MDRVGFHAIDFHLQTLDDLQRHSTPLRLPNSLVCTISDRCEGVRFANQDFPLGVTFAGAGAGADAAHVSLPKLKRYAEVLCSVPLLLLVLFGHDLGIFRLLSLLFKLLRNAGAALRLLLADLPYLPLLLPCRHLAEMIAD